jgi:L-rhamnose mutarotase
MKQEEWFAYMDDVLKQKAYAIYLDGEKFGLINGHDAEHAVHKMAQHEEIDPRRLTAERAWPDSDH